MAHVQKAPSGFADQRECRDNGRLQRLLQLLFVRGFSWIGVLQLLLHLSAKFRKTRLESFIAERLHFRFALVDGGDYGHQLLDVAFVLLAPISPPTALDYF